MPSCILKAVETNHRLPAMVMYCGNVSMLGKSGMDQIPFHAERIWTMLRFLAASELKKQDGHQINTTKI